MHGTILAGRIIMSAMFLFSGAMKLIDVPGTAGHIAEKGLPAPEMLAVLVGVFEIAAGAMLVVGWHTRIAAWALAGFCVLSGVLFHNFWAFEGPEQVAQMLNLFKNITIAGGFMILAAWGPGKYAIEGRTDRARSRDMETGRLNIA